MKRLFALTILATTMLFSCRPSDISNEPEKVPITFNAFLKEGDSIRPFPVESKALAGDLGAGYILNGAQTPNLFFTTPVSSRDRFYYNIPMNMNGTPKDGSTGKIYWNNNGTTYHSFAAYSINPTSTTSGFGVVLAGRIETSTAIGHDIYLIFNQPADPAKQIDLLTAEAMNILVKEAAPSAVNLYFSHRLSRINFKVFGSEAIGLEQCVATIIYGSAYVAPYGRIGKTDLSVYGLSIIRAPDGNYDFYADRLQEDSRYSGSYQLGSTFDISGANINIPTAVEIDDLILIPQDLAYGWAELKISYKLASSTKTVSCTFPALSLRPSMEYVISINILESTNNLTVTGVTVNPWGSVSGIIDYLPGEYKLSLSSSGASIPPSGASYSTTVNSNARWFVKSKPDGVVVDKLEGGVGSTIVNITIPNNTQGEVPIVFSTIGDNATASVATWKGTMIPQNFIPNATLKAAGWPEAKLPTTGICVATRGDKVAVGDAAGTDPLVQWKTSNTATVGLELALNISDAILGVGKINSAAMDESTHPAAKYCNDLSAKTGVAWYLPSVKELDLIYKNRTMLGTPYQFEDETYWTSSEFDITGSWNVNFVDGSAKSNDKTTTYKVRCIREI